MQQSQSSLSCNSCGAHVDGIAYRTSCLHLLCPACAKHSFADGRTCIICSTVLSKGNVKEAVVGVASSVEMSDCLFQMAFSSAVFGGIVENLDSMRNAFAELENFVSKQMLLEASREHACTLKAVQENEILSEQLGAASAVIQANEESTMQNQSETENLIKSRELELSELKEAYKEKHRKCQAWEKAYNNIRDQVVVPATNSAVALREQQDPRYAQANGVPPKQGLEHGYRRDQRNRSSTSTTSPYGYSTSDSNTPSPLYAAKPGGSMQRNGQQLQQTPPIYDMPGKALRRTEVTTYSKSFVPPGQYNEHRYPPGPPVHQRQDLPQHIYGGANAVAGNPYEVPGPRYIENYSSPPMPHQMVPHLQSKGYPPPQQAPAPSAMYQRAGLKRTRSPSRDPRAKSSFFD